MQYKATVLTSLAKQQKSLDRLTLKQCQSETVINNSATYYKHIVTLNIKPFTTPSLMIEFCYCVYKSYTE